MQKINNSPFKKQSRTENAVYITELRVLMKINTKYLYFVTVIFCFGKSNVYLLILTLTLTMTIFLNSEISCNEEVEK